MVKASTTLQRTKLFWNRYGYVHVEPMHKYIQLRQALIHAIDDGFWKYGEKLPPEGELARIAPFSLGTVQKAYAYLVREGMVERRPGAGSYVLRPSKILDTPWHFRFRPSDESNFLPVFPSIVEIQRVTATGPWSSFLSRTEEVVRIRRNVRIGTEFTFFAEFYVDAAIYDRAMAAGKSVEGVNLRRELGIEILRMTNDVRIESYDGKSYPNLNIKRGSCILIVETKAFSNNPTTNYYLRMVIPPTPQWLHISDIGIGASAI